MPMMSPDAQRIREMRAARDAVAEISGVVRAYDEGGDLAAQLQALSERWAALVPPPWERAPGGQ